MSTYKNIDKVCVAVILFAVVITAVFMNGKSLGVQAVSGGVGYASRLFDTSQVHSIDIVMDDWEGFIENCENEEYVQCTVIIDGEACKNVGIRAKGNTSLSNVSAMGSNRYSFKLEFDHYDDTKSYFGLDKLSLNNLIQDTTFMKDYLTYQMMGDFGVDAPLCSYACITVNGEDWGLYLAVEGVEEAFLQRNFGYDYGNLYKPDSSDFGGGPGNGKNFRMDDLIDFSDRDSEGEISGADEMQKGRFPENGEGFMPKLGGLPGEKEEPEGGGGDPGMPDIRQRGFELPEDFAGEDGRPEFGAQQQLVMPGMPNDGRGGSDVKLQYIDDDPDNYSNIFDSAKTDIGDMDKARLISSLKSLSEGSRIEEVVDIEEVIRYFVVHNFVCNGDSYTGNIVHNYYLYEKDGQLSMIPWDYNLAFGTFQAFDATSMVNSPIDTPVTSGRGMFNRPGLDTMQDMQGEAARENEESRPMVDWIFGEESYTRQYHQYFEEFLENVDFDSMIDTTAELIAPYVEKDPTKFYSSEKFEAGVAALKEFCRLRKESVKGQLSGQIPSTSSGQMEENSVLIDASWLDLSDMGTMEHGGGRGFNGVRKQ